MHLGLVLGEVGFPGEGGVGFVVEDFGGFRGLVDQEEVDDAADGGPVGGGGGGIVHEERGGPGEGDFAADLVGGILGGEAEAGGDGGGEEPEDAGAVVGFFLRGGELAGGEEFLDLGGDLFGGAGGEVEQFEDAVGGDAAVAGFVGGDRVVGGTLRAR